MAHAMSQFDLFATSDASAAVRLPDGFRYVADVLSADDEAGVLAMVRALPLTPCTFRLRRVRSVGDG